MTTVTKDDQLFRYAEALAAGWGSDRTRSDRTVANKLRHVRMYLRWLELRSTGTRSPFRQWMQGMRPAISVEDLDDHEADAADYVTWRFRQ